ncbi:NAD(P)/FAD-dependent oxidoreductase [Desulfopila sp. IMCC35006]|uniref:phytoene desaturase family protein n=1 Tax=Desulfopila sp. IMCC35006 TaxID=2569542 RepID=UPI0010AD4ECE|nr:NAD(P)/FAD-dependent oxidoreductase [Desulfopila sp. IMCC35006]TKB28268.1 NAD(P)/FAD-dependent oxidoreductase [Desulfopila sp. IMCC35006]
MTTRAAVPPKKVLIIGSGIGGLSTAIILAELGFDVTVLEKNHHPGGVMRSYTRDGIECGVGVHYLGSLDKGQILRTFFDYLGVTEAIPLTRMGGNGIIDRYIFTSPASRLPHFDLPPGMDAYEENLIRAFPAEQEKIARIMDPVRQAAKQLHALDFLSTPDDNFTLLDHYDPFGAVLSNLGCSAELRNVLSVPSSWLGVPLDDCPAYYHNMALASYVSSSWRLERNGAHMADVFAERLVALGGKIITDAEVSRIEVDSRVVKGLHLQSGEKLPAELVIGAVHPKIVLQMLSAPDVKPSYRKRISTLQDTHGIFSVHVSIDAESHREIPHNIFKIETSQRGGISDLKYYQIRRSEKKGRNLLSILTSGMDALWAPWEGTRSGRRGREYLEAKERYAAELVEEAAQMFGALKGAKVIDASTPLTMRDWVNSPGGSAYGVLRSSSQMLATALLNRTAVKGLYLAGQNVMAPGIIGTIMGSFSTVKLILGPDEFKNLVRL